MNKFKNGDLVKVVGASDGNNDQWDYTDEFKNVWVSEMDPLIGRTFEVGYVGEYGVLLGMKEGGVDQGEDYSWYFPPAALQRVKGTV